MSKEIIPVVFATDENYVPYCGVAISSLIRNASHDKQYEIYVIYDQILQSNICRLENLSTDHVKVHCICIHEYITNLNACEYSHLTVASAYRLVIPDVLPQYEKIIYLDSDLVVNADVAELYHIEIGETILAAVHGYYPRNSREALYRHITQVLCIDEENFFNAGVLLLNTKAFRAKRIKDKGFALLSERKDLCYMDQCVLNILCEGNVSFLPQKWNYEWLFLFFLNGAKPELMDEPAIIHYDGIEKPWDCPEQVLADYFWTYARQTIFYEEIVRRAQITTLKEGLGLYTKMFGSDQKERLMAVYGAGSAGKRFVRTILPLGVCRIILWVDQNAADKRGTILPVEPVEKLYTTQFDYVFIAIENKPVVKEIKRDLLLNGIPEEKILKL